MFSKTKHNRFLGISDFNIAVRAGYYTVPTVRLSRVFTVLFFYYWKFQMISLTILFMSRFLEDIDFPGVKIAKGLATGFIFGELYSFSGDSGAAGVMFLVIQLIGAISFLIASYIGKCVFLNQKPSNKMRKTWIYICYAYPYLAFPIFCFNIKLIKAYSDNTLILLRTDSFILIIFAIMATVWAIGWSSVVLSIFSVPFKLRDPFSTKTKVTFGMELFEKCLLYFLYVFMADGSGKVWALLVLNLMGSVVRAYYTFYYLPYYKKFWLTQDAIITIIGNALTLLNIICWIFKDGELGFPKRFVLITWLLTIPLVTRGTSGFIDKIYLKIFESELGTNPYWLMHLLYVLKWYKKTGRPPKDDLKWQNKEIMYVYGKNKNTIIKLRSSKEEAVFDMNNLEHLRSFSHSFLKQCIKKYSGVFEFKAIYAYVTLLYKNSYLDAANYIQMLGEDPLLGTSNKLIVLILREMLSEKIIASERQSTEASDLNIPRYILLTSGSTKLREMIFDQAKLQQKFWSLYTSQKINFKVLLETGKKIEEFKVKIEQFWKKIDALNDKRYVTPYLIYGLYLSSLNNKPSESDTFIAHNVHALSKLDTQNNIDELRESTAYQSNTSKVIVSASKSSLGIISEVSESFLESFHYRKDDLVGVNVKILLSPFYRDFHDYAIARFIKSGVTSTLNKTLKVPLKAGNGYIVPCFMHMKQNPLLDHGLNFISLFRPIKSSIEYVLVKSDATIDGFTKPIGDALGLTLNSTTYIYEICPEYRQAADALRRAMTPQTFGDNRIVFDHMESNAADLQSVNDISSKKLYGIIKTTNFETPKNTLNFNLNFDAKNAAMTSQRSMTARSTTIMNAKGSDSSRFKGQKTTIMMKNSTLSSRVLVDENEAIVKLYQDQGISMRFLAKNAPNEFRANVKINCEVYEYGIINVLLISDFKTADDDMEEDVRNEDENQEYGVLSSKERRPSSATDQAYETETLNSRKKSKFQIQPQYSETGSRGSYMLKSDANFSTIIEGNDARKVKNYKGLHLDASQDFEASERDLNPQGPSMNPSSAGADDERKDITKNRSNIAVKVSSEGEEEHQGDPTKINTKTLIKKLQTQAMSESVASSNGHLNHNKFLETCVDKYYVQSKYIIFMIAFAVVLIVTQGLVIAQNIYVTSSRTNIKFKGDIVLTAYARADFADLTSWAVRLLRVGRMGWYGDRNQTLAVWEEFRYWLKFYMDYLLEYNNLLEQQVASIEPEFQIEFYQPRVKMYVLDQYSQPTGEYEMMTAFQASQRFYSYSLIIYDMPFPDEFGESNYYMDYIIYNSLDELMLECERTIELTKAAMTNTIDQFQKQMEAISGVGLALLIMYALHSLYIFKQLCNGAERFSKSFTRISEEDCYIINHQIERFLKGLSTNFTTIDISTSTSIGGSNRYLGKNKLGTNQQNRKGVERRVSFTSQFFNYLALIFKLWPLLILIAVVVVINLIQANDGVVKIKQLQAQMVQVIYYMYITDITFNGLIDWVTLNGTTTLRNRPIYTQIKETTTYGGETKKYLETFRNADGTFDKEIEYLLFNSSCFDTFILPEYSQSLCMELSGGSGIMSLIATNPIYEKTMQEFADSWLVSARTPDLIPEFMRRYYEYVFMVNAFQNFYIVATQITVNNLFFSYIEKEQDKSNQTVLLFSIAIELLALATIVYGVWKFKDKDYELKKLMRLVPLYIIVRNRFLKYYLVETSSKMGETLKRQIG